MARRHTPPKPKPGLQLVGVNDEGQAVCVDAAGRIVVGDGCFEFEERDGDIYLTFDPKRCRPDVRERFDGALRAMTAKQGSTIYTRRPDEVAAVGADDLDAAEHAARAELERIARLRRERAV